MATLCLIAMGFVLWGTVKFIARPSRRRFPVENHTCIVMRDGSMIHDDSCRCSRNQGARR